MAANDNYLSLDQYMAAYPNPQAGPCMGCGATSYGLSMGGPGLCPACDSTPPERRVKQLAEENRQLRARVAELENWFTPPMGWGHTGPCSSGCTCVNSGRTAITGTWQA